MSSPTTVVNVRTDEFDVYIGRPMRFHRDPRVRAGSELSNPWRVGRGVPAGEAVKQYRPYFASQMEQRAEFRAAVEACRGMRLGCWCKVHGHEACHGDVIVEWLKANPVEE